MTDETIELALDTIGKDKQALVFVSSRASAEKTAEDSSEKTNVFLSDLSQKVLKGVSSPTKQCKRLSTCVRKGIAFHHAGLTQKQKDVVEEGFKEGRIKIICATPTLCLSGETEIWQPQGNNLAENFRNSDYLFVLSQSNKLQVMKSQKINKIKNSSKLIQITSVSGCSIKLTPNHKVLVKRNNRKHLINAVECQKKDKIATVGKLNIPKTTKPKLSDFVIDNNLPVPDRELTKEDFYFIGSMLGDGHSGAETRNKEIFYKGSPSFTSGDLESIKTIEKIVKSFDPFSKRVKRFGSISLVLSKKKWFREFLCQSGVDIGKNKYINNVLMQANLDLVKHLLIGLFDTDGCVEKSKRVSFSNISLRLIKNIQKLLLRFGIVSRVRKRPGKELFIIRKIYKIKDCYELTINQNKCLYLFHKQIGFNLNRKQINLENLILKISHILYSQCKQCDYKIYSDIFSGRSKEHKRWGCKKRKVIELLGKEFELGSREIQKRVGFLPRHPKGNRLNHHYELISRRRIGPKSNTEWFWSLKPIGSWIYWRLFKRNKELSDFFQLSNCPICKNKLGKKLRKKWRDSDFDRDIFWDFVRDVKEVEFEEYVYDVVLPNNPKNDHMFVANGFIVHNSMGVSFPAFRVIMKNLKRYSGRWGMDWIPVLEYHQMTGRAGRPEFEPYGEAISVAKSEKEKKEIYERYVRGVPEDIYSKLAVEPVFRTYLLSLIATNIIKSRKDAVDFFSKTFWAFQFRDMDKLKMIIDKMLMVLDEYEFVKVYGNKKSSDFSSARDLDRNKDSIIKATLLGQRVSQLYLDPFTAHHLINCLRNCGGVVDGGGREVTAFSFLQMISNSFEMFPLLRVKVKEHEEIQEKLVERYNELLEAEPTTCDSDYDDFINSVKTALFFDSWIDEQDEDFLLEKYGVRPGEVHVKLGIADWLLYSSSELAKLLQFQPLLKEINKLRIRVKHGVKEELLPLLKLKGVGRKRARKLHNNGIKDIRGLNNTSLIMLSGLIGQKTAEAVKEQLGAKEKPVAKGKRVGQLAISKFE